MRIPEGEARMRATNAQTQRQTRRKIKEEGIVFHTVSHCNGAPDVACTWQRRYTMIHARRQSCARDSTASQRGWLRVNPPGSRGSNSRVAARALNPLPDIDAAFAPHCKANRIVRSKEQNISPLSGNPSHELHCGDEHENPIMSNVGEELSQRLPSSKTFGSYCQYMIK